MSFVDKMIFTLDEQNQGLKYIGQELEDIKINVQTILNGKIDGFDSIFNLDIDSLNIATTSFEFCSYIAKQIHFLISKHEKRIIIKNINYDDSLKPIKMVFMIYGHHYLNVNHQIIIKINLMNNRYCEVI